MSTIKVKPEEFEKVFYKALKEYGDEVLEISDKAAKSAARQTKAELKSSAPEGGKYARGWSSRTQKSKAFGRAQIVYNRDQYQLIHLLESPHRTGYFGHYPKNVDYTGTIARIEDKENDRFMEEVMAKL